MKKSILLLGAAMAFSSASFAQVQVQKLVKDAETYQTYDFVAEFNAVTNNQTIGTQTRAKSFTISSSSWGNDDRDPGKTGRHHTGYTGTNFPEEGTVWFGTNSDQKLKKLNITTTDSEGNDVTTEYYGAYHGNNKNNAIVIFGLQKGDKISIKFVSEDGTTTDIPYAVGKTNAASFKFTTEASGELKTFIKATDDVEGQTASTFTSEEVITLEDVDPSYTGDVYLATLMKGLIQKVVITRGTEIITYDYEAEAKTVLDNRQVGEKLGANANTLGWTMWQDAENGDKSVNNFKGYKPGTSYYTEDTEGKKTYILPYVCNVFHGNQFNINTGGLLLGSDNQYFLVDSIQDNQEITINFSATANEGYPYFAVGNTTYDLADYIQGGDTLKQGDIVKSGEPILVKYKKDVTVDKNVFFSMRTRSDMVVSKVSIVNAAVYNSVTAYELTTTESSRGTITTTAEKIDGKYVMPGETVTVTATPGDNYDLVSISATTTDGTAITITDNQFTMPEANVIVSAEFKLKDGMQEVDSYLVVDSEGNLKSEFTDAVANEKGDLVVEKDWGHVHFKAVSSSNPEQVLDTDLALAGMQADNLNATNWLNWSSASWTLKNQADISFSYVQGNGNPYVSFSRGEEKTNSDGNKTYSAEYEYYEADGSKGLPQNGTYVELTPDADGMFRIGFWANKGGSRSLYIVDETEGGKAFDRSKFRVEGYVNGANNADGTKYFFNSISVDENYVIGSTAEHYILVDEDGVETDKTVGAANQVKFGYFVFDAKKDHTYIIFGKDWQFGWNGFTFTVDGTIDEYNKDAQYKVYTEVQTTTVKVGDESRTDTVAVVSVDKTNVKAGETLVITPEVKIADWELDSISVLQAGVPRTATKNNDGTYSVVLGHGVVVVAPVAKYTKFKVKTPTIAGISITADKDEYKEGETVTLTVDLTSGYMIKGDLLVATSSDTTAIIPESGVYSFAAKDENMTIIAVVGLFSEYTFTCTPEGAATISSDAKGILDGEEVVIAPAAGYTIEVSIKNEDSGEAVEATKQDDGSYIFTGNANIAVYAITVNAKASALSKVKADTETDNTIYDLAGRKVNSPKQGLYIRGGKLILVK